MRATEPAAERVYEGAVAIDISQFETVAELAAFRDAVASLPEIQDIRVRMLGTNAVRFELQVAGDVALIAELQACAPEAFFIRDTTPSGARLEIFHDV